MRVLKNLKKAVIPVLMIMVFLCSHASALEAKYTDLNVPAVDSSFKSYMDYRTITNTKSPQYKFIARWGWTDENGFLRVGGEKDLGIADDYYVVALGSFYGTEIGTKYEITTSTGNVFYAVLGDCKANIHTNSTNQYGANNNIVEFLVDTRYLDHNVKRQGTANVYNPLNGSISSIRRIDFTE